MTVVARNPLSKDRILDAAVRLVDHDGLDGLSMRKLGASLGVEAMSLYNHVANKDEVLDGVLDRVLREVPLPDPAAPWDEQLRMLAHGFRRVGELHPGVLPMFGDRAIRSVEGFAPLVCAYQALRNAGLDPDAALDAFLALASFVLGFALVDRGAMRDVSGGQSLDLTAVEADDHARPGLVEFATTLGRADSHREFERGLDLLLDGLRGLVGSAR